MSKSRKNFFETEDSFEYERGDPKRRENNRTKHNKKRMDRALKSGDIESLMNLEDEYEY